MSISDNLTLSQAQQYAKQIKQMEDIKGDIVSTMSQSDFALYLISTRPEFIAESRKALGVSANVSDKDFIEGLRRVLLPATKPSMGQSVKPVSGPMYDKRLVEAIEAANKRKSNFTPEEHFLDYKDGKLTLVGRTKKDDYDADYFWYTPSRYCQYWVSMTEKTWVPIYGFRVKGKDGVVREFVRPGFGGHEAAYMNEYDVVEYAKYRSQIVTRMYPSVLVLKKLLQILHDEYGDIVNDLLAKDTIASWLKTDGAKEHYEHIFVMKSVLAACGVTNLNNRYILQHLPGTCVDEKGNVDKVVIFNAGIMALKSESGNSDIYDKFNNGNFYSHVATDLISRIEGCSEARAFAILDSKVQFLVRPE